MRKPMSEKRRAIKKVKFWIAQGRKLARQVNRKLDSLSHAGRMKELAKQELIRICQREKSTGA